MENMKLSPMTDFVIQLAESKQVKLSKIVNYAKFLQQPLTLGMFVPCNEAGEILEEPHNIGLIDQYPTGHILMDESLKDALRYTKAKENVLFEGFEVVDTSADNDGINEVIKFKDCYAAYNKDGKWHMGNHIVEFLTGHNVTLTNSAITKIFGK